MIKPRALKTGDRVAILAPASRPLKPSTYGRAQVLIEAMGLIPVLGQAAGNTHGFSAGSDEERLDDLNWAIGDPDIACIWAISGGFGSLPLLAHVDYETFRLNPKVVIGADDVSHLLLALHKQTGVVTFHGPNLDAVSNLDQVHHYKKLLQSEDLWPQVKAGEADCLDFAYCPVKGEGKGQLLPFNLTALVSLFGTPYEPETAGRFLLLEDTHERNDILDRWFTTLYLSGALSLSCGLGVGVLENCDSRGAFNMLSFEELVSDRVKELSLPTCFNLPFSQGGDSGLWPVGVPVHFSIGEHKARLNFLEPCLG